MWTGFTSRARQIMPDPVCRQHTHLTLLVASLEHHLPIFSSPPPPAFPIARRLSGDSWISLLVALLSYRVQSSYICRPNRSPPIPKPFRGSSTSPSSRRRESRSDGLYFVRRSSPPHTISISQGLFGKWDLLFQQKIEILFYFLIYHSFEGSSVDDAICYHPIANADHKVNWWVGFGLIKVIVYAGLFWTGNLPSTWISFWNFLAFFLWEVAW